MKAPIAIIIATLYLFLFIIAIHFEFPKPMIFGLFTLSPLLLVWVVIMVLKDTSEKYPDMNEDQEWGYFHR
ncbi:MAG: hypothetical protein ACO1NU_04580 [Arcticibacter sp.]